MSPLTFIEFALLVIATICVIQIFREKRIPQNIVALGVSMSLSGLCVMLDSPGDFISGVMIMIAGVIALLFGVAEMAGPPEKEASDEVIAFVPTIVVVLGIVGILYLLRGSLYLATWSVQFPVFVQLFLIGGFLLYLAFNFIREARQLKQ